MNKIGLIIRREFLTRVRKKTFLIMTIIGPLLMGALFVAPILIAQQTSETSVIQVLDETGLFYQSLQSSDDIQYEFIEPLQSDDPDERLEYLDKRKAELNSEEIYALLYIPCGYHCDLNYIEKSIQIFTENTVSLGVKSKLQRTLEKELERLKLTRAGVNLEEIESAKTSVTISTIALTGDEEVEQSSELSTVVGLLAAFLIYLFIFLYGAQVMRGVIEEKSGKVVEVIVSSVRPFQLLMGKIVGVALVGLAQFTLWVILTTAIVSVASAFFGSNLDPEALSTAQNAAETSEALRFFNLLQSINFPLIIGSFLFYFLGGYLMYGALFAAIGSAVDSEADTQQFMLPVTVPLILAIIVGQSIIEQPDSALAFWFSIIPLTSPVVMMIRVVMGVAPWELALSMICLIGGFMGTVWLASRVYRVGILMHGKKVSYGELWKWIKYKG